MHITLKPVITACIALSLAGTAIAADSTDTTPDNLRAVDQHIVPAYQNLQAVTAGLASQANTFCRQPDDARFATLRQRYRESLSAWQSIQHIRFGPIEYLTRAHRFELWPDKRGTVGRHLSKLLAAEDSSALQPDNFASGSVAVQGLSALERLLFDADVQAGSFAGSATAHYRCQVVQAIGRNLAAMSARLTDEWADQRDFIATAHGGNDFYDSDQEVSAKLLNNLHTQLQVIVEQKLERPLGANLRKARGKRAESWRSEQSLANIRDNLVATRTLYDTAFSKRLQDEALGAQIEAGFVATLSALDAVGMPLHRAVKDPAARQRVEDLHAKTATLKHLLGNALPAALGLALGFNSLDGD